MGDALLVLQKVAQALSDCGIPWFVGGSLASSAYGTPRTTQDVDFVIALEQHHIEPLVRALETEFYLDAVAIRRALFSRRSFNVIHLDTMYKADLFVLKNEPFAQEQMRRRQQIVLPSAKDEITIWFCTAEDTVLQKLYWYQKGGGLSDQQWRDVQGVLKVQDKLLDNSYLQHWAQELGLHDLLTRALSEAGVSFTTHE